MEQHGRQSSGQSRPPRQQQQFNAQGSAQPAAGTGVHARFSDHIREHMEVVGPDGQHVGTVDAVEEGRIKLTKEDSKSGKHKYLPLSLVAGIEGDRIRLAERGDADFGIEGH